MLAPIAAINWILLSLTSFPFLRQQRLLRVGWPEGVAPSGSRRSRRDNLSSPGSCHPDHQEPCAHAQWAKSRGYWRVMRCQQAAAFFMVRNRLYFLRVHRIR